MFLSNCLVFYEILLWAFPHYCTPNESLREALLVRCITMSCHFSISCPSSSHASSNLIVSLYLMAEPTIRAVFFGVLEYSQQTHSIYQKFGFVSVPNILVTHPKSILDEGTKFSLRKEDLWEFNAASEVHTQKVLDFVNSRTERNVEIKVSTFEALFTLIYSLLGIGIICYIGFVLRKLLLIPYVWFAVGMLVYLTCMAGVVYDIIHGVPWIGTDQQGQPEFIHTGQRSQYGLEGFMMSFVICAGGLAIVGINLASKITNVWTMRGVGGFSIIVLLYSLFRIIQFYKVKANWYNPGMAPPGHYTRGPLIRDQGNSF